MSEELVIRSRRAEHAYAYRRDIDGLRAIAVTAVVLFHAGVPGLSGGFVGVDIFFVLSGFLIGGIIEKSVREDSFSFVNFYARRARRILPALLVVIATTFAIAITFFTPSEFSKLGASSVAALLGASNIYFFKQIDYFNPSAEFDPLLMTWSLGVEEQFYIFIPFLFIFMKSFAKKSQIYFMMILCFASLALSVIVPYWSPQAAFYLLPARAWELGVGVLLAQVRVEAFEKVGGRQDIVSLIGVAALFSSIIFFDENVIWPGYLALVPTIGTALLLITKESFFNRKILSSAPFVAIGLLSYSWYLWHWPLLVFLRIGTAGEINGMGVAVAVTVSLAIAFLSWKFVEGPFRSKRHSDSRTLRRYGLVMIGFAGLCIAGWQSEPLLSKARPQQVTIERQFAEYRSFECRTGGSVVVQSEECGTAQSMRPKVAIVGDSHAAALARGLIDVASKQGEVVAVFSKSSCRPLYGVGMVKDSEPQFADSCEEFTRQAFSWIEKSPSIETVILAGLWNGPLSNDTETLFDWRGSTNESEKQLLSRGIGQSAAFLQSAGKRVLIVEDTPYWVVDPLKIALANQNPVRRTLFNHFSAEARHVEGSKSIPRPVPPAASIVRQATIEAGAIEIFTNRYFCPSDQRPYCDFADSSDNPYFVDRSHLSQLGASRVISLQKDIVFAD